MEDRDCEEGTDTEITTDFRRWSPRQTKDVPRFYDRKLLADSVPNSRENSKSGDVVKKIFHGFRNKLTDFVFNLFVSDSKDLNDSVADVHEISEDVYVSKGLVKLFNQGSMV